MSSKSRTMTSSLASKKGLNTHDQAECSCPKPFSVASSRDRLTRGFGFGRACPRVPASVTMAMGPSSPASAHSNAASRVITIQGVCEVSLPSQRKFGTAAGTPGPVDARGCAGIRDYFTGQGGSGALLV